MSEINRRWIRAAAMATLLAAHLLGPLAATARAQTAVADPKDGPGVMPWVISIVIVILVAGVAFMNSKRSHLD